MKKSFLYSLIGILMFVSCNSGNNKSADNTNESAESQQEKIAKPTPPKSEGPIRVLFVGNSHTEYFASFPMMLEALSKENNKQIEVHTLIEMGVSVDKIIAANATKASKLFAKTDTDGNYFDYIILQESTPVVIQKESQFILDCKIVRDMAIANSPDVATYIYELTFPTDYTDADFNEGQTMLVENTLKAAKSIPNTGILKFGTVLSFAYQGKEGYIAIKDGKDMLRHTDNSHHMLNDAVFLNSIVLYQTLFNESPKIPAQLPLATGTGNNDEIKLIDVSKGVSNVQSLEKIAASFK